MDPLRLISSQTTCGSSWQYIDKLVLKSVNEIDPKKLLENYGHALMTKAATAAGVVSLAVQEIEEKQIEILERGILRLVISKNSACKVVPFEDETIVYEERRKRIRIILCGSALGWGAASQWHEFSDRFASIRAKLFTSEITWLRGAAQNSEIVGMVFRAQGNDPISEQTIKDANGNSFEFVVVSGQMAWALASNGNWDLYIERIEQCNIGCEPFHAQMCSAEALIAEKVAIEVAMERERLELEAAVVC